MIEERKTAAGTLSYRARIRLKGQPEVNGTFARRTDAKRWIQDTESAIREGRYFALAEARRHTFGDLIDRYLADVLPHKPKSALNTRAQLLWWKEKLGDYRLADVGAPLIARFRDDLRTTTTRRGTKMAPATVVRYLAALSHVYTVACNDWGWVDDTPLRKVSKPKEPRGRERFLSDDERLRLLKCCEASTSQFLHVAVVLAISTGMRRGEIMNLGWPQIDLARGRILLHKTKNGASRAVPLAGKALEMLTELAKVRRIGTTLVFYGNDLSRPVDLTKPWKTALSKANLSDFRFHDLRHSAASYLAMNGASTIEIAAVLGHKTLQMVKRYSHLANSHTAAVVQSMNEKIFPGSRA